MEHMRLAQISSDILGALDDFCNQHMLQWLEVMSVTGAGDLRICEGLQAVRTVLKVERMLYLLYSYSQHSLAGGLAPRYLHGYTPPP